MRGRAQGKKTQLYPADAVSAPQEHLDMTCRPSQLGHPRSLITQGEDRGGRPPASLPACHGAEGVFSKASSI